MERPIIEVRNLSKRYRLGKQGHGRFHTLRDRIAGMFRKQEEDAATEFWALRDVDFEVRQGEMLGVIGANGAGKSTLLKILSRITEPTKGEITLRGRVASLLEVGTGFHPELTGRENIFLNGVILGMHRAEIARKFDEIVEFSGVEKFLDTPVKRYSSGMYVRLAFSVAAHMDPEILVVDEVLAVGDAAFQKKCLGKMRDVATQDGKTVLFVSHNLVAVRRLCQRAVLLKEGTVQALGEAGPVCELYESQAAGRESRREWSAEPPGNGICRLLSLRFCDADGNDLHAVDVAQPFCVEMVFNVAVPGHRLVPNFHFHTPDGQSLCVVQDLDPEWRGRSRPEGTYVCRLDVPKNLFSEGTVLLGGAMTTFEPFQVHFYEKDAIRITLRDAGDPEGSRGDYIGHYPGMFRPRLNTSTRHLPPGTPIE